MSSTEEVLTQYREATAELDPQGAAEQHADDAVVISRGEVFRGRDEIERHYEELFDWMEGVDGNIERHQEIIEGPLVHVVWSFESPELVWEYAVDTFVIQDGQIVGHTVAVDADE